MEIFLFSGVNKRKDSMIFVFIFTANEQWQVQKVMKNKQCNMSESDLQVELENLQIQLEEENKVNKVIILGNQGPSFDKN